jgi:DNA (cytosine-5)-methyltransferase 1
MSVRSSFQFIDLFAGIGGFHLALETLGGECVLASELDPACREVYSQNFPTTHVVGDIHSIAPDARRLVPRHDVLCAGFPCQPFSKSGFQKGLRDRTRGTLFYQIMEIVRAHHPRFLLLENVRNLAGPRHVETWRIIIDSLREEGYLVADEPAVFSPHLLPPSLDGRPQVRERVFILAELVDTASVIMSGEPLLRNAPVANWNPKAWLIEDWLVPDHEISNIEKYQLRAQEIQWIDAWQDFMQTLRDEEPGFPIWVDDFKMRPTIDASTPAWKANFLHKNSALYRRNRAAINRWRKRHDLKSFPASRRKFEWQARGHERDLWKLVLHLRPSGIRVKPATYLPALVAITQTSIIGSRRRRITPREAARLQGVPDWFELHPVDAVAYRQFGNAVNVGAVRFAANVLFAGRMGLTGSDRAILAS